MHHFSPYRDAVRTCAAALVLWSSFSGSLAAQEEKPAVEIRIAVADVEYILEKYWRTPRAKETLERYKRSEEYRRKEAEVARLERELASQRFWFFGRRRTTKEVQQKRRELEVMAEQEAEEARQRESEAVEGLLTDVRKAAAKTGREQQLTVIFDSNTPQILFLNANAASVSEISDTIIETLNTR